MTFHYIDFSLPKFYRKNQLREVEVGGFSTVPNFTYMLQKFSYEKCFQENWLDKSEIEGLVICDGEYWNIFIRVFCSMMTI